MSEIVAFIHPPLRSQETTCDLDEEQEEKKPSRDFLLVAQERKAFARDSIEPLTVTCDYVLAGRTQKGGRRLSD